MGGCISWLAVPSDATSCAAFVGVGGATGAPLRSHKFAHVSTETMDVVRPGQSASQLFEYVTSSSMLKFTTLMQFYVALITLRTWSYVSSLRYLVVTPSGIDSPSNALVVYLLALVAESIVFLAAMLLILQQNGAFKVFGRIFRSCCGCQLRCCSCCNRRAACCRFFAILCCCSQPDNSPPRRRRVAQSVATGQRVAPDVVVSDSDGEGSASSGDDDVARPGADEARIITALRWRYPLTRPMSKMLRFGSIIDGQEVQEARTAAAEGRQVPGSRWRGPPTNAAGFPVDAHGVQLEEEHQVMAANYAIIGGLPPDPDEAKSDRAVEENRTFAVMVLAFWLPNAVMSFVDWYFYSSDQANQAYNGFFWVSFVMGFVAALLPPWYYWSHFAARWLERRNRARGCSAYSDRFKYGPEPRWEGRYDDVAAAPRQVATLERRTPQPGQMAPLVDVPRPRASAAAA